MIRLAKCIFLGLLSIALSGCAHIYGEKGVIKNRDTDYLQSHSIPRLKFPPGVPTTDIQDHYPVPARDYPESAKRVNLVPPEL